MKNLVSTPELTFEILSSIITDAVQLSPCIRAVGIVGSFARGEEKHSSDVDLVISVDKADLGGALEGFGRHVKKILDNQFNRRLDIIRYEYIHEVLEQADSSIHYIEGFEEMLRDLRWLYER